MTTAVQRLPMPDWSRPGETWRVEREPNWHFAEREDDWLCEADHGRCLRPSVAYLQGSREAWPNCAEHLRKGLMWIERGQVVSWRLRP